MGLEVTTNIAGLNASNPVSGDALSQADDHFRLIKDVLKQSFPGSGGTGFSTPITATEAEINRLVGVTSAVQTQINAKADLASPVFTGNPTAPTPSTGDNDTSIATTAFVKNQAYATLADPALTGNPTAPTAAAGDNDTSIATTAFVCSAGWFESSEQTITNNTLLSVSHGLGRIPKEFMAIIRCKITQYGYAVDDEVQFTIDNAPSGATWGQPPAVYVNSTTIGFHNTNVDLIRRDTGTAATITNANWRVVFRCR